MRKILFPLVLLMMQIAGAAASNVYYVDAATGNDASNGLSPDEAWQSLWNVNNTTFGPGDKILFKAGCRWTGQLRPKGCGAEGNPICVDMYGDGDLPYISQGDAAGIVFLLHDQDQWEIRHLELDGGSPNLNAVMGGIQVWATNAGRVMHHIVISDCVIRNNHGSVKAYESSAIWVGVPGWNGDEGITTGFDDVLIENNRIYGTDRNGILVWTSAGHGPNSQFRHELIPSTNVVIRGNEIEDIGGDAILVLGSDYPLIEGNTVRRCCLKTGDPQYGSDYNPSSAAIWLHHCLGGVMQYNAVYDCYKQPWNNDGMAYDFDFNCTDCILQYNLSCNNEGGFLLIMNTAQNNVARYNVSENDRSHVLFCVGSEWENNHVHNNTFYIDHGSSYIVSRAHFSNNIFMADSTASMWLENPASGVFKANCYSGNWANLPPDPQAVVGNPMFVAPGRVYGNEPDLQGYALRPSSPCLRAGIQTGGTMAEHDILGNPLSPDTNDIGAVHNDAATAALGEKLYEAQMACQAAFCYSPLLTKATQINATGTTRDNKANLVDGKAETDFALSGTTTLSQSKTYITINLGQNASSNVILSFSAAAGNNKHTPSAIALYTSNDNKTYTHAATLTKGFPADEDQAEYTSEMVETDAPFRYLRILPYAVAGETNPKAFSLAELKIYGGEPSPESNYYKHDTLKQAIDKLSQQMNLTRQKSETGVCATPSELTLLGELTQNVNDLIREIREEEASGIRPTLADNHQQAYNLSGCPIRNVTKPGIYIVNGRKVLTHAM